MKEATKRSRVYQNSLRGQLQQDDVWFLLEPLKRCHSSGLIPDKTPNECPAALRN